MSAGEPTRDATFLDLAFQDLVATGAEFPIKVEGAKTLPYTAVLRHADPAAQTLGMKLFRPLPPALAPGARFDMVFFALGKRYEGRIILLSRDGYLQYQFQWPQSLLASDRRLWKRYPFRPREHVYVTAQDDGMPCCGLNGPLVNLSMGGLMFRVDRMIRLEDGMPVTPEANRFTDCRALSPLRIQGLFPSGVLEARARLVRVDAFDSSVHLAVAMQGITDADRERLTRTLEARDRKGTGAVPRPGAGEGVRIAGAAAGPAGTDAALAAARAGAASLRRLDRRASRLLAVVAEGEEREALVRHLHAWGFWRLDLEPDLASAQARSAATGRPHRLLVVDLEDSRKDGLEAVGAIRRLEPLLRGFENLPVAFALRRPDPVLGLLDHPGRGAIALEDPDPLASLRVLDRLLDLEPDPEAAHDLGLDPEAEPD